MMSKFSRRSALQLGVTLSSIALAGCASTEHHIDTTTPRPELLSVGDTTNVGQGTVTVQSIRTQQMFIGLKAGVHPEVYGRPDTQYVIVDVLTDEIADPTQTVRNAFHLSLDSTQYNVVEEYLIQNQQTKNSVSIAFPIPTPVSANTGKLVWTGESSTPDTAWTVPQEVLDVLTSPPEFTVTAFKVPATTTQGSSIEPAITVQNSGGNDGTFIAELGSTILSDQSEIRVNVPKGERVTHVESISLYGGAGSDETIVLDWGTETMERSIHIES